LSFKSGNWKSGASFPTTNGSYFELCIQTTKNITTRIAAAASTTIVLDGPIRDAVPAGFCIN
jgi:hypothetical protein